MDFLVFLLNALGRRCRVRLDCKPGVRPVKGMLDTCPGATHGPLRCPCPAGSGGPRAGTASLDRFPFDSGGARASRPQKYVLREAARPVLTATVYGRHKHPFLTPPAALSPSGRLHELVQETLRGPALASLPFYDRARVIALLDGLPALGDEARTALDPVLMILLSACALHEQYKL